MASSTENQVPLKTTTQDLRLIYHPLSPYSRKVYMLAHELGLTARIALDKVVVAPTKYKGWSDDNDAVARSNPLAKIPTLVCDGDGIYDSRIIADYLLSESGATDGPTEDKKRLWRLKTLHACADGILDAQVLLVYEDRIRTEKGLRFEGWVEGQTEKITRGLDRLEFEAGRGTLRGLKEDEVAAAAEVAVAAALGFMDIMKREWRGERTKLADWFATSWEGRASFVRTRPDVDWKTGDVADLGLAP